MWEFVVSVPGVVKYDEHDEIEELAVVRHCISLVSPVLPFEATPCGISLSGSVSSRKLARALVCGPIDTQSGAAETLTAPLEQQSFSNRIHTPETTAATSANRDPACPVCPVHKPRRWAGTTANRTALFLRVKG